MRQLPHGGDFVGAIHESPERLRREGRGVSFVAALSNGRVFALCAKIFRRAAGVRAPRRLSAQMRTYTRA